MNRIPTWDEVVMNLKCYKSVILPLVTSNGPLIALANLPQKKQLCKSKNYPFIIHPARLLVGGKLVVGPKGFYCGLFCWREAAQGK
jgi:hypothetical protein